MGAIVRLFRAGFRAFLRWIRSGIASNGPRGALATVIDSVRQAVMAYRIGRCLSRSMYRMGFVFY